MRQERPDHTWQPTALVNELYLELGRFKMLPHAGLDTQSEKDAFLKLAGFLMKRLLTHHARPLYRRKKEGTPEHFDPPAPEEQDLAMIDGLLSGLGRLDPVLPQIVEMKVFEGMTREQIANRLGCSVRTVGRHWEFARQWLREAMSPHEP